MWNLPETVQSAVRVVQLLPGVKGVVAVEVWVERGEVLQRHRVWQDAEEVVAVAFQLRQRVGTEHFPARVVGEVSMERGPRVVRAGEVEGVVRQAMEARGG